MQSCLRSLYCQRVGAARPAAQVVGRTPGPAVRRTRAVAEEEAEEVDTMGCSVADIDPMGCPVADTGPMGWSADMESTGRPAAGIAAPMGSEMGCHMLEATVAEAGDHIRLPGAAYMEVQGHFHQRI